MDTKIKNWIEKTFRCKVEENVQHSGRKQYDLTHLTGGIFSVNDKRMINKKLNKKLEIGVIMAGLDPEPPGYYLDVSLWEMS